MTAKDAQVIRLLVAMLLVAALLAPTPVAASSPRAKVTIGFADGVSAEDRAMITEGFHLAQDAFLILFNVGVRQPVTVSVATPTTGPSFIGQVLGHQITIQTTGSQWPERSPAMHLETEVHEYFHVLQAELSGRSGTDPAIGPAWLVEGSAEFVGYQVLLDRGIIDAGDVEAYLTWAVTQTPHPIADLRLLEDARTFSTTQGPTYALGQLAVVQLTADRGPASLRTYFAAIAKGKTWRQAFKSAFRQTPDAFYAAFVAFRQGLGPTGPYPHVLEEAATPNPNPAWITITSVTDPVRHGDQALLLAATDPGTVCTLVVTAPDGKRVLARPATTDLAGKVFWLWTVTGRLAKTTATATVDCGADPAAVAIEVH